MSEHREGLGPLLVVTALADEARTFLRGTKGALALHRRRATGGDSPSAGISGSSLPSPAPAFTKRSNSRGEVVWVGPGSSGEGFLDGLLTSGNFAAVLFTGLAGSLSPRLPPGSILVADEVVTTSGTRLVPAPLFPWALSVLSGPGRAGKPRLCSGRLLSSVSLVGTPAEKERWARETGALAVDMESAGWLGAALRAGVPAAVVRVISDGVQETLPPEILSFVASDGSVSYGGILRALLSRPALLSELLTLWPSLSLGRTTLARMGGQVATALQGEGA